MEENDMKAELERLRAENAALKNRGSKGRYRAHARSEKKEEQRDRRRRK